jgi:5-hydroxyisourate hydrolase
MSAVTTHVLDTSTGRPAAGIPVRLEVAGSGTVDPEGARWVTVATAVTDADGRVRDLGPDELSPGVHRLVFDTAGYLGRTAFFPEVAITFEPADPAAHYHLPLLLSPYGYSTYRGS